MRAELAGIAPAEVRSLASECEDLRAKVRRLVDENRSLTEQLGESSGHLQAAREEAERQREQLALAGALLDSRAEKLDRSGQEREAAKLRCSELEAQNQAIVEARAVRESELQALLLAERAAREQLAEEVRALNANAEETALVAEQLISANLNSSIRSHGAVTELAAARGHAEALRTKLDEANHLYRVLRETLDGFGRQLTTLLPDDGQDFDCVDEPQSERIRRPSILGLGAFERS
jgi:chromosome segregation ATPase